MSGGRAEVGSLYNEIQCIMGNGHMRTPPVVDTGATENITFLQLRWRVVMKGFLFSKVLTSICCLTKFNIHKLYEVS